MGDRVQKHVLFSGHVQGVGFRASLRMKARAAGLDGWVANRADGRVEAVLAGPEEDVDEVIEWCRDGGIPFARVSGVGIREEPPSVSGGFEVR